MPIDRGRIIEGLVIAVLGGIVTATVIAVVPSFTRWLVRPSTTPGQIVAFEGKCPERWTPYVLAGGRVIVGAGPHENKDEHGQLLRRHQLLDVGGEEVHTLTIPELPAHSHTYQYLETQPGGSGLSGQHSHQEARTPQTAVVGDSRPHNNLQPYIALHYCKAS
jgi:hypothetical protein